ncbi:hypothetical protein [Actinoplanes sp. G11-F43]|uniref:hypothetical protein n=1 Tax=Actinoplanes sp. G11-F43 TaxID=3424130 RepID=UPI003D32B6C1
MSDDRIQQGLDSYAEHLQRTTGLAPSAEIRRRGDRRRRNRATGAAFAAVLIAAVGVGTVLTRQPGTGRPIQPAATPSPSVSQPSISPSRTSSVASDVSRLRARGLDLETGVLIFAPDAALDRWMAVGADDVVDFTGRTKDASTEMSLIPAVVEEDDRVIIVPVARPGWCVTDTPGAGLPLALRPCRDGQADQTWAVTAAGDSGNVSLTGPDGPLYVGPDGLALDAGSGFSSLQIKRFDG